MYQTTRLIVFGVIFIILIILPFIKRYRKSLQYLLSPKSIFDSTNPFYDFVIYLEVRIKSWKEALHVFILFMFWLSCSCSVALILSFLWPLVVLCIIGGFIFYSIFKYK